MSARTAIRQAPIVTFATLLVAAWLFATIVSVAGAFDWSVIVKDSYVGQSAISGLVGLVVMVVAIGLFVVLYSELGETTPAPDAWESE